MHLIRLITWCFYCFHLLFDPHAIGLHIILFFLFIGCSNIYLVVKFGWKKVIIPLVTDIVLSFGLVFLVGMFGFHYYNGDHFWVITYILSLPLLILSGLVFQLIYFRTKIFLGSDLEEISEEMKHYIDFRVQANLIRKNASLQQVGSPISAGDEINEPTSKIHHTNLQEEFANLNVNELTEMEIFDNIESIYESHDEVDMICPICHVSLSLGRDELNILRNQGYLYCPNCSEKVSVHEILEPSYNSLIEEHRKILSDMENFKKPLEKPRQTDAQHIASINGR